jgi:hypothetical protein
MKMKISIKITLLLLFVTMCCWSCVKTPADNSPVEKSTAEPGDVYVLSEGLQGYDNSEITLVKTRTNEIRKDIFRNSNNGEFLGDTANDLVLKSDTAFIALSTSSIIRAVNVRDGKKIRDLILPTNCTPRHLVLIDDTTLCVTCLMRSSVVFVNSNTGDLISEIATGPQPEGIARYKDRIFVANSAYGDFNYMHPDAETISVISISGKKEITKIFSGPNSTELLVNPFTGRLYSAFYNLPSLEDSTGGVVEYDIETQHELRRWNVRARSMSLSISSDTLFFISQQPKGSSMSEGSGLTAIDLKTGLLSNLVKNPNKFEIWYGLSVSPFDGSLWVCNAKNHINSGEVLVYNSNNYNAPIHKFEVMLNPNKVIFLK